MRRVDALELPPTMAVSVKRATREYVVRWRGCLHRDEHGYYTDDRDDAIGTARVEHERGIPCCDELRGLGRSR